MPLAFPPFATHSTPGGAITIAASTWRWDGVSGSVLVSSGFWLKPGYVTAANLAQFRVFVAGVEQAVALHPLDGPFPDGSYRSMGIQYTYPLTNNTPVPAEIRINQGVRGTTDLTWVEPTRVMAMKKAVIAPTDPAYMCATFVTLGPLTPAANDAVGQSADWAAKVVSMWSDSGVANGANSGGAIYEHQAGLMQLYCRTGTRAWYQAAYDWSVSLSGESGITAGPSGIGGDYHLLLPYTLPIDPNSATATSHLIWNPENLVGVNGSDGAMGEALTLRLISCAVMYWVTAWRQFKRTIARYANQGLSDTNTSYAAARDHWISGWYGQRLNFGQGGIFATLMGYLTGCTSSFATPGGLPGVATWDYATYLPWILDALEETVWALGGGDYRDGLVGQRDDSLAVFGGDERYGITNFQLTIVTEWLMMYNDLVKVDARIPGMIQTICDYMILQSRAQIATDLTYPNSPYVSAYDNIPPATVASSAFTATLAIGNPVITWTAGVNVADLRPDIGVAGTGISAGTKINSRAGTAITLNQPATVNGSQTLHLSFTGWNLAMFPPAFAWMYAYSGNSTYLTWADRAGAPTSMNLNTQLKNWGEFAGSTRHGYLYYRQGGTVRGTPGVHPTVITNPPLQPTLG